MGSVVANVLAVFASEQSASEPPIPNPMVSKPESSQVNAKAAWGETTPDADVPTGSMISIADHPPPLGSVVPSTIQSVDTSTGPGSENVTVSTGVCVPSLNTHLYDTAPPPPTAEIRPAKVIFTGQTLVISAGSALTSRPTTWNPVDVAGVASELAAIDVADGPGGGGGAGGGGGG